MTYDIVIIGGGPSGLSAALALGRARKRVLLCDAGPRRNQAAEQIHNFVTRDGTPPDEFRSIAREQLAKYPNVEIRDARVERIAGEKPTFRVELGEGTVEARRVLLCMGMVDQTLPVVGFDELWGHAIFQCPYCHGWEVKERRWGCLVSPENAPHVAMFAAMLRGWTSNLVVFLSGAVELPVEAKARLESLGIRVESSPLVRLIARGKSLEALELADGRRVPCEVLFAHPPQRQVALVGELGLALDDDGFVKVDPMQRETSVPGIYASGDLTTRAQGAVFAAADGVRAAAMINFDLTPELVLSGQL